MSFKQWARRLKRVGPVRLVFICPFRKKTCFPLVHRDDTGFWDACRACGLAKRKHPFASLPRGVVSVELTANPYERPNSFHFECRNCQFSDEESRKPAGPLDFFCPLCWRDNHVARPLFRWPIQPGQTRYEAYTTFIKSKDFRVVNDAAPPASWRPHSFDVDMGEPSPTLRASEAKEGRDDAEDPRDPEE